MWLASFPPRTIHSALDLIDFASFDALRRPVQRLAPPNSRDTLPQPSIDPCA